MGKCITLLKAENGIYKYLTGYLPVKEEQEYILRFTYEHASVQFYYGIEEKQLEPIGPVIDGSFMSDEACREGWFTGSMCGICCQDLTGSGTYADFDYFEVKAVPEEAGQ